MMYVIERVLPEQLPEVSLNSDKTNVMERVVPYRMKYLYDNKNGIFISTSEHAEIGYKIIVVDYIRNSELLDVDIIVHNKKGILFAEGYGDFVEREMIGDPVCKIKDLMNLAMSHALEDGRFFGSAIGLI